MQSINPDASATEPLPSADCQRVLELIGSIFYHGNFKAETANERELETLLRKLGYFFETEDELMRKLNPS